MVATTHIKPPQSPIRALHPTSPLQTTPATVKVIQDRADHVMTDRADLLTMGQEDPHIQDRVELVTQDQVVRATQDPEELD